ncbi:hypothetical protein AKJ37_05145 [candidate division MSBL1 archaeon SCGC-AAA259I09]|uniref:DUF3368 domain-containing protein n=1 Tax=candidate division MSBL1 archaeon SCGC-AAA259I09 TaxID=1698267 RepID=A0A133UQF6_9EURY|nr:hypothetical protein AKJ37_05145 [candidate division MSBL1 archaeon SCGC-AAA259I09]
MIVSNASPLIYLAKAEKLSLLHELFGRVHVPRKVKEETVDRGKEQGESDALIIEKAVEDGWIQVHEVEPRVVPFDIEEGETAALSLAKELDVDEVLVDEAPARKAARMMDLEPRGTVYVLLSALKQEKIDLDSFLETLDDLVEKGFRLKEEVYIRAIRRAREIVGE